MCENEFNVGVGCSGCTAMALSPDPTLGDSEEGHPPTGDKYHLPNLITWCRVFLKSLIVTHLVRKFPAFMEFECGVRRGANNPTL
jgi:hypothetical protein